jgi:hypothetical protein
MMRGPLGANEFLQRDAGPEMGRRSFGACAEDLIEVIQQTAPVQVHQAQCRSYTKHAVVHVFASASRSASLRENMNVNVHRNAAIFTFFVAVTTFCFLFFHPSLSAMLIRVTMTVFF